MELTRIVLIPIVATLFVFPAECASQSADPQYGIKFPDPPAGSMIRRYAVGINEVPINRRYEEFTSAERAILHNWWEGIPQGDEPPFPLEGLKPIHEAVRQGQSKLLVRGKLFLIATVSAQGEVIQVKAVGSPSPEMTKFAASVLLLTRFKPAVCAGKPCVMDFPMHYEFRLE